MSEYTEEECKSYAVTIRKIWRALGVMNYTAANGKSIDELVLLIKQQRDDLLAACKEAKHLICNHPDGDHRAFVECSDDLEQAIAKTKL